MEVLNSDNKANLGKKKRVQMPKPASLQMKKPTEQVKADVINEKIQPAVAAQNQDDDDDSYEFNPVCENCSG